MTTIRELSVKVQEDPQSFYPLVASFISEFRRTWMMSKRDILQAYRMVMDEPVASDHPDVWSTYLASMVEALFEEVDNTVPSWVFKPRYYLPEPTFWVRNPGKVAGLEETLRGNAHPCFAKRNLFFSKNVLRQV